jgi:hypothetical protein
MQNTQSGNQFAQHNLDAAVNLGTQATQFWRKCAQLQAQGASQVMEESLRITRTILQTQSEMVAAAGQFLTERQRMMQQNIEQAGQEGMDAVREAGGNGSHAIQQAQRSGQPAKAQGHHRAS